MAIKGKNGGGITYKLERWGQWRRDYIIGIGWKSSGLEAKIIEGKGKIYDSGCYGKGVRSSGGGIDFRDGEGGRIDTIVKRLSEKYPVEMAVVKSYFVIGMSKREISDKLGVSRHTVGRHLRKGVDMVRVGLDIG